MRYLHRRVKMNGYKGEVVAYDQNFKTYSVKFDAGHPFMVDTWNGFSEARIKMDLLEEKSSSFPAWFNSPPNIPKRCTCGVSSLNFRDISPYSHSIWCPLFKSGYDDKDEE